MGKKTNCCLNLVFPIIWILINISAVIRRKQKPEDLGMLENMQFEWENLTLSSVVYITVDLNPSLYGVF